MGIPVQPLDLETIFINYFAGSTIVFVALAMVFFAYLGAKFRMTNGVFGMFMALFVILLAGFSINTLLVPLVLIIVLGGYWILSKIIKY